VTAVATGEITRVEAFRRYRVSAEEFLSWWLTVLAACARPEFSSIVAATDHVENESPASSADLFGD
jgi:hypothetical protein